MFFLVWRRLDFRLLVIWMLTTTTIQVILKKKLFLTFKSLRKNFRRIITNVTLFAQISLLVRIRQTKPSCWGNKSTCISGYNPYRHLYFHQYFKKQIVALYADLFIGNIGFQIKTIRKKKLFSRPIRCKTSKNRPWSAFPALAFSCLPAVIAGSMISCSLHHLHVLPPLARVASFPALDATSLVTASYFPSVTTTHMILLENSDWLIYHYLRKFLCFIPIRARPIVEMDGKIILSTKQISLEDNKTMRLASDRILRKRYPF